MRARAGRNFRFTDGNVQEAIFDVRNGQVVALSVSVYNRGDAGDIEKKPFEAMLDELRDKIQRTSARTCVPRARTPR